MDLRTRKPINGGLRVVGSSIKKTTKVFECRFEARKYAEFIRTYVFEVVDIVDGAELFYGYGVPK
jgi:hypothetical protein